MKTPKHRFILLVSAFFFCALSTISYADGESHNTKSVFVGGASASERSSYKTVESNGTELGTSSDTGNPYASFAGELTYQSKFLLGAGVLFEGTRYPYTTGGASDGELGIYFMPRLAQSVGIVEFWAGVGLGLMSTSLGGSNSGTVDGITITMNSTRANSFAWTPRVGIDVDLTQKIFLGVQVSYTRTTFSVPFTATEGPASITGSEDCTRSWVGGALRLGSRL